ncbi:Uncharacterised protein [Mycobacteroides abscessus subsp. abscessus]|nr:Uncharacterised protein [Mycobacteroides abscessus subsp. abscessus]
MKPSLAARPNPAMVAMRPLSATRANETSAASSVPTRSSAASTGPIALTRSCSPGPYSTGRAPYPRN